MGNENRRTDQLCSIRALVHLVVAHVGAVGVVRPEPRLEIDLLLLGLIRVHLVQLADLVVGAQAIDAIEVSVLVRLGEGLHQVSDAPPAQLEGVAQDHVDEAVLCSTVGAEAQALGQTAGHSSSSLEELLAPLLLLEHLVRALGYSILHELLIRVCLLQDEQRVVEHLARHARR